MKKILQIFPTSIYIEDNFLPENLLAHYEKLILENENNNGGKNWFTEIKTSFGTHNLVEDENFSEIITLVNDRVISYNNFFKCATKNILCDYAWFNIYENGDYQEVHHHSNSIYSGVFFLKAPEKSSPLVFFNLSDHLERCEYDIIDENNMNNFSLYPVENTFVLFKSYIKHMVPKHKGQEKRLSLSFNFNF